MKDRFLKVERGKTPLARRRIDLTDAALAILKARSAQAAKLDSPYLFPCDVDSKRPLPGIQSAHARALADSNVAAFRPYDLRHTWATRAAEAGIDLVTLASMLGHSRIRDGDAVCSSNSGTPIICDEGASEAQQRPGAARGSNPAARNG